MRLAAVVGTTLALVAGMLLIQARLSRPTEATRSAEQAALQGPPGYTLPAGKLERAISLASTERKLSVAAELIFPAELILVLVTGWAGKLRDLAYRVSRNRWLQGYGFWLLLLLTLELLSLPLQIWGHRVALAYGLSVQGWASWLGDKAKLFGLVWLLGGLL